MQRVIRNLLFALAFVVFSAHRWGGPMTDDPTPAGQITFELFSLDRSGARTPLSHGTRYYPLKDIFGPFGLERLFQADWYNRAVMVTREFSVGASIFPEADVTGFGLWMRRHSAWYEFWSSAGFSWEWFKREDGMVFCKLQGPGKVRASFVSRNGRQELVSVEFLEDVLFRLDAQPLWSWWLSEHRDTHNMLVRAGSVLHLAP